MDIITKIKNILQKLYSKKLFRFFFFAVFILIVVYKYSNMKVGIDNIVSNPEIIEQISIPKKVNIIKAVQDKIMIETDTKNQNETIRQTELEKIKVEIEKKEEKERQKQEKVEKLKKEFTSNIKKNAYVLKNGDMAEIKIVIMNGNKYNTDVEPLLIPVEINRKSENIFGKKLIGKKVGQIVIIPFSSLLEDENLVKNIKNKSKGQSFNGQELNLDILKDSQMIYLVKIIGLYKK